VIKRIKSSDLCRGMYVILPHLWFKETFSVSHFLITSEEQLQKIEDLALGEVSIDTLKGLETSPHRDGEEVPPEEWDSGANISTRLKDLAADTTLSPDKKAGAVYNESMLLMERLFQGPTAKSIGETKQGIFHVVDIILSDNAVALQMLGLLSHDYYTYTHCVNVGVLSVSLAKALYGKDDTDTLKELGAGFFFHDIGKVSVSNAIINKRGKLTEQEMGEMRTHPYKGYEILEKAGFLTKEAELIVLQHHERSDGGGYPRGLKGREIHEYGRICSVADVFDALTSDRSYHSSRSSYEALTLMREKLLGHFERDFFESFVLLFGKGEEV